MTQLSLFYVPPPAPVTSVVTAFKGTGHEMRIEITVQPTKRGKRWRRPIVGMRVLETHE